MTTTPNTLAALEAELASLHAEKRGIVAHLNGVPLRQLTRQNAEYVLLLDKLRQLRVRVQQLRLAQDALLSSLN